MAFNLFKFLRRQPTYRGSMLLNKDPRSQFNLFFPTRLGKGAALLHLPEVKELAKASERSANEVLRTERGLLTVSLIEQLVAKSLGEVHVLCVIARCRSGKTWAAKELVQERSDDLQTIAYVDCQRMVFGELGAIFFNGNKRDIRKDSYPKFDLDGIDIVVVDEPTCNIEFVKELIDKTTPELGAAAHRLTVLLLQDTYHVRQFHQVGKNFLCFDFNK